MIFNSFNGFDDFDDFDDFKDFNKFSMDFDDIISKYGLKSEFILTKEDNQIIINEIWSDDDSEITANRIYEFDSFFIELIPIEIRLDVLNEVLDILVEDENYEEAAIVRDQIKEII